MSLTTCLKKAGDYMTPADKSKILVRARELRSDGSSVKDAALSAISELIDEAKAQVETHQFAVSSAEASASKAAAEAKESAAAIKPSSADLPLTRSPDREPVWRSPLQHALEQAPERLGSMSAPQWAQWLKANAAKAGVKQDEITWSGIEDYLKMRGKDKLSREELAQWVAGNGVKVEEKMLGENDKLAEFDTVAQARAYLMTELTQSRAKFDADHEGWSDQEIIDKASILYRETEHDLDDNGDEPHGTTKYGRYTLPGGSNYRELLLTLPVKMPQTKEQISADMVRMKEITDSMGRADPKEYARLRAEKDAIVARQDERESAYANAFSTNHWDELNVLAHIRVNDRADTDGNRVLFVEELQSDWGQQGKKEGFDQPRKPFNVNQDGRSLGNYATREESEAAAPPGAHIAVENFGGQGTVPTGPFVTSTNAWLGLALKRVIKLAVDEGYDKVAFVNGDQSAARYDLSHQVDAIDYRKPVTTARDEIDLRLVKDGQVKKTLSVKPDELDNYVGKELAKKIMSGEGKEIETPGAWPMTRLEGLDLKVGGEGMKAFYDKIVPQEAGKLVKKLGGDGLTDVTMPETTPRDLVAIAGMGKDTVLYDNATNKFVTHLEPFRMERLVTKAVAFHSVEEAQKAIQAVSDKMPKLTQHGFEITPEMVDQADGGMPLFSRSRKMEYGDAGYADAGIHFSPDRDPPKKTVTAYKLFRMDKRNPGKLFPLFVLSSDPVPLGKWVKAVEGPMAGDKVKSKIGPLAYRPGWHAGDLPVATHIGLKEKAGDTKPSFRNPDHVWAEVEMAADRDWQTEADKRATRGKDGKIIPRTAHITDQIPDDGFYRYKTHTGMTGQWLIGGAIKVKRLLSDAEVKKLNLDTPDLPRTSPLDVEQFGFRGDMPLFSRYRSDPALEKWADDALSGRRMTERWKKIAPALPHKSWLMAGLDGRLPVTIDMRLVSHLKGSGHQEVTSDMIGRLEALMANPRAMVRNEGVDERGQKFVRHQALLDARDDLGRPLLVAVRKSMEGERGQEASVYDVRSMFGRQESMQYMIDQLRHGNVVWMSDKEAAALQEFTGQGTMPSAGSKAGARPFSAATTVIVPGDAALAAYPNKGWNKTGNTIRISNNARNRAAGTHFSRERDPIVDTPAFKSWFGASKVSDERGDPQVVYTGTSKDADFKSFKIPKSGAWFTIDPESASEYARENDSQGSPYNPDTRKYEEINTSSRVIPAYLRIENPYELTPAESERMRMASNYKLEQGRIFDAARAKGYDGVDMGGGVWVAIKDPSQIKSAVGNDGGFDPSKKDITKSRARWTDDRISGLLSKYGYTQDDNRTKAYAGRVRPEDFVAATTPTDERGRLADESTPLDRGELEGQDQEIYLEGKVDPENGFFKVTGHEGRHRMLALKEAGVESVPVIYYVGTTGDAQPLKSLYATPQVYHHAKAEKGFLTGTLIPVSWAHRDELRKRFGRDAEMERLLQQAKMPEEVMFSPDRQTDTPEFNKWFEGSKVIDEDGKPLVVYHGTASDVQSFDPNRSGDNYTSTGGDKGFFFTNKPGTAGIYAEQAADPWRTEDGAPNIMPVYLSMKNPYVRLAQGSPDKWFDYNRTKLYKTAADRGFDGIIVKGGAGAFNGRAVYVAFHPEQIKSAIGNDGGFEASNQDITKTASRSVAESPEDDRASTAWQAPGATKFDDMIYRLQDKHVDTKRVMEAIRETGAAIKDDMDVYLQEELFHGRAAKRTEDFVHHELEPLVEQMKHSGLTVAELDQYLHARHAEEANEVIASRNPEIQDGGSGMLNQDAAVYFAELPAAKREALEAAAAKVDAMLADTRKLLVEYQLESPEKVQGWADMFEHYVPLMREDEGAHTGNGTGQGFSIKGKEVKSRTGSTRKVVDILANVAMQRERTVVRGEKNRIAQALVGLAKENKNSDFWSVDIPPKTKTFNPKTGLVEENVDPMFKQRENVLVAKIANDKGEVIEHAVSFNEKNERAMRMASALKNLDAAQLEGVLGASAKVTRYFAAVNTQYNPVFGVVNLMRDVQESLVNLGSTELAGKHKEVARKVLPALRGVYSDLRAVRKGGVASSEWGHLWEDFQDAGGQTGYRQMFATSADRAKEIENALNPDAWMNSKLGKIFTANGTLKVPLSVAQRGAKWMFDWLSDYNESMENSTRLAVYKTGLDNGLSRERAASIAKNITVNFNRKGQMAPQVGALYAFFNASVQGTARMGAAMFTMQRGDVKTIRLSSLGKKILYGGMLLGTLQAMAIKAAGFNDDDPPDFVKNTSLIIPIGNKKYITIPSPMGLRMIPALGRVTTEWALDGFKSPTKRAISLMALFADAFNPIGNAGMSMQTLSPTVFDPLVALTENKDFAGRPIAKTSSNKATPGFTLARDTSTAVGKLISEAINDMTGGTKYTAGVVSPTPDQIDYLIQQVTGGVGRELSKLEQTAAGTARGEDVPIYKIPLAGRFIGDAKGQASEGNSFYANKDRINELDTEMKGMKKDGKFAEANQVRMSNPEAYLITQANHAELQIQKLKKQKSEMIKADAPRADVIALEAKITARMASLNRAVEALGNR